MRLPRRKGPAGPVHAVRRTGQPGPRFNYELFNCNNFNIRYWSWNYRGCWPCCVGRCHYLWQAPASDPRWGLPRPDMMGVHSAEHAFARESARPLSPELNRGRYLCARYSGFDRSSPRDCQSRTGSGPPRRLSRTRLPCRHLPITRAGARLAAPVSRRHSVWRQQREAEIAHQTCPPIVPR